MSIKLIAIDMDETLLRDDKSYDSKRFNQVVKELDEKGIIVMIATGNPLPTLQEHIEDDIKDIVYLAAENGNFIVKNDEVFEVNTFSSARLVDIEESSIINDEVEFMCSTGFNQYAKKIDPENKEDVEVFFKELQKVDVFHPLPDGNDPIKAEIFTNYSVDENKEISQTLNEQFTDLESATSSPGWIDIYHKDGGKGYAVQYIHEKYNISPENSLAFGDSLNDASMMEHVKYSVAMENADEEFKDLCDYIIGTNEEQAVIDVLEQLVEKEHLDFLNKI